MLISDTLDFNFLSQIHNCIFNLLAASNVNVLPVNMENSDTIIKL